MKKLIELKVNGDVHELAVEPHRTLLQVLREDIGLTGAKTGCDLGECGTCTVHVEGRPVLACLTLALEVQGKDIVTIEGLVKGGKQDPLQQSFIDHGAVQCGFCTAGVIMTAKALLANNPSPADAEIRRAISGNLCRCTGYVKIVEAIKATGKQA